MPHKHRLISIIVVLVLLVSIVGALTTWQLYRTAVYEQKKRLYEIAQTQAYLMEAVAHYDAEHTKGPPEKARRATLLQIERALQALNDKAHTLLYTDQGFELIVAEQQGEQIVFLHLHSHRIESPPVPPPTHYASGLAQPMRRALQGQGGVMTGLDYRGVKVLAAYQPVPSLQLAVVAKTDLVAVRAPFIRAMFSIALVSVALVLGGILVIFRLWYPLIDDLRRREARFRELFEHMSSGVAIYDPTPDGRDFVFADLNPAGERSGRSEKAQLLGRPVTEVYPGIKNTGLLEVFRRVYQSGQAEHVPEMFYQNAHSAQWMTNYVYKIPNGQLVAIYDDITARKQAEDRLRENETLFRLVIDNLPVLIAYLDTAQHYRMINLKYRQWFQLEEAQIIGKSVRELVGEQVYAVVEPYLEQVQAGKTVSYQDRVSTPDGWYDFEAHYLPHFGGKGEVAGYIVMVEDITTRKHMEQERERLVAGLQDYAINLEERVAERTQELARANQTLQKLAQTKDEFLAGVSHELRSPLNAMLIGTEILLESAYGELTPKQHKLVENIDSTGHHLLGLINDILDVAKIEAGKMTLSLTTFDPIGVCDSCLTLIKETAIKKHVDLISDYAPAISLEADSLRLKQILLNLLSNAVKFTPAGGEVGLEFESDADAAQVRFTVWDTGIGIAPEAMDKLFQPFVQVDGTLSRTHAGTGLGLALVKSFTELHGGSVEVQSAPNQGSRFTVVLPWRSGAVSKPRLPGKDRKADGVNPAWAGVSVLIVDDFADVREMIADFLEFKGFRVHTAEEGSAAIRIAREEKPQIILLDIQMPGMDGFAVTRHLRADKDLCRIPIVALTALAMPGDREGCLAAGMDEYLSKPVKLTELLHTITTLLSADASGSSLPFS